MDRNTIEEAKQILTIPALWKKLDLPGEPPRRENGVCRSPFREDQKPSFSVFAGGKAFKDHATGEKGDAIRFLERATGLGGRELLHSFVSMAFGGHSVPPLVRKGPFQAPRKVRRAAHSFSPTRTRALTPAEVRQLSNLRRVSEVSLALMAARGFLRAATVRGQACWVVVEPDGSLATARRFDGEPFVRPDGTGYKSHALTPKPHPLGISAVPDEPRADSAILLCEGEGDFMAAFHFIVEWGEPNLYPVALLGRTMRLSTAAAERLAHWRIRAFPHADADENGLAAMKTWIRAIPGARADAFLFDNPPLHRPGGAGAVDLNDCTDLCESDVDSLDQANPLPFRHPTDDPIRLAFDLENYRRGRRAGERGL